MWAGCLGAPPLGRGVSPTVVRVRCKGCADVSENLRKLIGVAVMAAIVVVGVVATSGDDSDFTRNAAFAKGGVMTKEAPPAKGGDCCDEALYRIAQLEERIARLEGYEVAREELRQRTPVNQADLNQLVLDLEAHLERDDQRMSGWRNMNRLALSSKITSSRLLLGVEVEMATLALSQMGFGFQHALADSQPTGQLVNRGTHRTPDLEPVIICLSTEDGITVGNTYVAVGLECDLGRLARQQ